MVFGEWTSLLCFNTCLFPFIPLRSQSFTHPTDISLSTSYGLSTDLGAEITEILNRLVSTSIQGQEYWSGLPCPPPGDLPDPGIEPGFPLDFENPLEKGMETHWSILAWRIPWAEEPGGL